MDLSQSPCPIGIADRRLFDALNLLVEAKQYYFEPDRFRLTVNNAVQTLRNITFVLQHTGADLPSFHRWYSSWQETMRADLVMKWLVESRNLIVKQRDLEMHSKARISIVDSWFDPPKLEILIPPFTHKREFTKLLKQRAPVDIRWDVGLLRVERRWVDSRLPDYEILEALVHSFGVLSRLLVDAHNSLLEQSTRNQCRWFAAISLSIDRPPPCMLAQDWDRTIWVDLHDGEIVMPTIVPHKPSKKDMQRAAKRYPFLDSSKSKLTTKLSLKDEAAFLFEQAKNVLKTDGYHVPIAILGYPDKRRSMCSLIMADRADKHLLLRGLAAEIEKTGADSVIIINEVWISTHQNGKPVCHAADDPNREEGLQLIAANEKGNVFIHTALFSRDKDGNITINNEPIVTDFTVNLIEPIREAWRRKKQSREQWVA